MRKRMLVILGVCLVGVILAGCGSTGNYENGKSYSTAAGDDLPVDICNVDIAYQLQQTDVSGASAIPMTAQVTNKTDVAFTDSYYIELQCADGSTGNLYYSGDIEPGQTVDFTGSLLPKTAGYMYKGEDISFTYALTGFDPNDKQHGAISCDIATESYEWDFAEI